MSAAALSGWGGHRGNDCPAAMNKDGVLDFFDVSLFLTEFNAGCS